MPAAHMKDIETEGSTTMSIAGIRIPDSAMAREITELVRDTESELLFHHSDRKSVV